MANTFWGNFGVNLNWLFWLWALFFLFSSIGNWGYTYRSNKVYHKNNLQKKPIDILCERYAKGEILLDEFIQKRELLNTRKKISSATPT